jgi:protein-L-isoaspartate O-methyltransferase
MCSSIHFYIIVFMAAAVLIGAGYGWAVALFPVVHLAGVVARVESTRRRASLLRVARRRVSCVTMKGWNQFHYAQLVRLPLVSRGGGINSSG